MNYQIVRIRDENLFQAALEFKREQMLIAYKGLGNEQELESLVYSCSPVEEISGEDYAFYVAFRETLSNTEQASSS